MSSEPFRTVTSSISDIMNNFVYSPVSLKTDKLTSLLHAIDIDWYNIVPDFLSYGPRQACDVLSKSHDSFLSPSVCLRHFYVQSEHPETYSI